MRTPHKLVLLTSLYFSQGLPGGFFAQTLPVLLRKQGVSLAAIGSVSLLAMPWVLKFLWAPLVDRWGTRRSWIVPLQLGSCAVLLALAQLEPRHGQVWLFAGVFLSNLLAATQDIATDGLAIDLLSERERGLGNGVQVAGYRVGMIAGGGLLLVVFETLGWAGSFSAMAGALLLASLPVWLFRELPRARAPAAERVGLRATLRRIVSPAERRFVAVLVLYRAGGSLASAMLRPWLVDRGHSLAQIGWLLGTLGFVASLLGALLGGVIVSRVSRRAGLVSFALLHAVALLGYAACALSAQQAWLSAALALEHLLDGMATAALFTTMMDHTRPDSAATDYTAQASLVAGAAGLFGLPSGLLAQAVGYPAHFALAAALTAVAAAVAFRGLRIPFQGFERAR